MAPISCQCAACRIAIGVDGPLVAVDGRSDRPQAMTLLEVAELGQHAGVAAARQGLLITPPGFGVDALVAPGLCAARRVPREANASLASCQAQRMRWAAASGVVEGVVTRWHLEPACQGVSPNSGDEGWHGPGENSGLIPVHLRPLRGEAMTQRRWLARSAFALLLARQRS
jgi:hypothetical protein